MASFRMVTQIFENFAFRENLAKYIGKFEKIISGVREKGADIGKIFLNIQMSNEKFKIFESFIFYNKTF